MLTRVRHTGDSKKSTRGADQCARHRRPTSTRRFERALWIGPLLLLLAATAYGILAVHGSTDVWIGLAAGRQILTADQFPTRDSFSYTFAGQPWYNQNWLTHLAQYWLYTRLSPNAVIYATWATSASMFALVLLAAYWRSGTWLGAVLAAAVVALGCRDYLSPRPATAGFLCLASAWALLCALEGQRHKRRWWPLFLLLPLLLVWGNAHGSFVFGYGLLGLYVGHWLVVRTVRVRHSWSFSLVPILTLVLIGGVLYSALPPGAPTHPDSLLRLGNTAYSKARLALLGVVLGAYALYWTAVRRSRPPLAASGRQTAAIVAVIAAAFVLTVVFGPFGIDNFTHGAKVAGSRIFRRVAEWRPAYQLDEHFPPVWRFWTIFGFSLAALLAGGLLTLKQRKQASPQTPASPLNAGPFDLAVLGIGLAMTLWARRFAPIYFIFGAPAFLTWIVLLGRPLGTSLRRKLRRAVMATAGLLAIVVAARTGANAYNDLVTTFAGYPQFNLLERVVRYDLTPHAAVLFLKNNSLHVNLLVEWSQAGVVMLQAPNAKVFIDGRAQQVYDEKHYAEYHLLLVAPDTPRPLMMRILDRHNTNAVLLRRWERPRNLGMALDQSPDWVPVLLESDYTLFLRRDSRPLAELGELLRRGAEWRPDSPAALAARGLVWEALRPPDLEQAITCWRAALRQNVTVGKLCFPRLTKALLKLGRKQEARRLVEEHYRRLNQPFTGLPELVRRELLETLTRCRRDIVASISAGQAEGPDD